MKRIALLGVCVCVIVLALSGLADVRRTHAQSGGGYDLTWYTVDGGGADASGTSGGYTLVGTIGQPDAAVLTNGGGYLLAGGFWTGGAAQYNLYLPLIVRH